MASERLCAGIGQALRKDDSCDSTLAIYQELFIYDVTTGQEREKARLHEGIGKRKDDNCDNIIWLLL